MRFAFTFVRETKHLLGKATFNCSLLILKIMALKIEGYYPLTISLNCPVSLLCILIKTRIWKGLNSLSRGLFGTSDHILK